MTTTMLVAAPTAPGGSGPAAQVLVDDPLWLMAVKALVIFVMMLLLTLFAIWWERKLIGWMQNRRGPNRAGPAGILQSLADGLKLPFKEDIVPSKVDKIVHFLAPVVVATPVFITFSVIPLGPTVWMFGHETALQVTDLPVAGLLVLVTASIGVYGFVLAGWASRSPYALLGGLRSSAQVISYEIAMALSFVAVFLYAGSLSTSAIVEAQEGLWYAVALIPSFVIYLITMVGETNRLPFDLPEGEGELVGGYHTEYSSMKFAMFFLAEYINIWTVSALATTLFLGGWHAPWPLSTIPGANEGWIPLIWFFGKIFLDFCCFVWLRAAVPRVRYDQLMRLGWKVLIPVNLGWIMVVATIRAWQNATGDDRIVVLALGGVIAAGFLGTWLWFDSAAEKKKLAREAAKKAEFERLGSRPDAGGFPVPPLDLPHYHGAPSPSETSEKEVSGA